MANYKLLSYGSQGSEVEELQKKLNATDGSYNLDTDGIYGDKTKAAVQDYQKRNNLAVDGIAGDETLGHLYGTGAQTATSSTPAATTPTALQTHQSQQPGPFTWDKQADANQAWQNYLNREDFSYDLTADPMYQQYKQQYMNLGKLAMLDTMGQAAAMTGGYGNSYAQTAGQQAYQGYLQQLNEVAPELYGQAYNRWQAEGEALYNEALAYETLRQQAYNEHQDTLSRWYTERDYLTTQQNNSYDRLMNLLATGYDPTDEELKNAGMTRAQAKAIQSYYTPQTTAQSSSYSAGSNANYDNGDLREREVAQLQEYLNTNYNAGLTVDGKNGVNTANAVKTYIGDYSIEDAYDEMLSSQRKLIGTRTAEQFKASIMTKAEFARIAHKYDSYESYVEEVLDRWSAYLTDKDIKDLAGDYELPGWEE